MGFILAPIALILFALIGIIHSFLTIIVNISRRAFFRKVSKLKYDFAFDVDVFGNYLFRDTWNVLFLKSKHYQIFGTFGKTLSSAFGEAREEKVLNVFGLIVSYIIDVIWFTDWLKGGHCKASIMSLKDINLNREKYK